MKGDPAVSFALMGEVPVITFGSDLEQICRRICTESVRAARRKLNCAFWAIEQ